MAESMSANSVNHVIKPVSGAESKVESKPVPLVEGLKAFISTQVPKDTKVLEIAVKTSEEKVLKAMEGSAKAYMTATQERDAAVIALRNATSLTKEEATKASVEAHIYVMSLHSIMTDFDALHGVSHKASKKGSGKASSAGNTVSPSEWASVPQGDKDAYKMTFDGSAIALTGESGDKHTCRTIGTLARHMAN
jgi:hypothetical protein